VDLPPANGERRQHRGERLTQDPDGIYDATGSALYKGQIVKATADQSMQPGDGAWGFNVGTQAYRSLWHIASVYAQGTYLFNPEDTNGVATFRSQPGQSVMSVTDQYLYRAGISQGVPKLKGLALSLGVRGRACRFTICWARAMGSGGQA